MNLVIDYFQFGSDPLALALSSDIADKSVTVYTDDGTTKTYVASFPFDDAFHNFTIDDGSTNFRTNFHPVYGFMVDCYDADDNFIALSMPVVFTSSILALIYPYDQNGALITETELDDVYTLVSDKSATIIQLDENLVDDVSALLTSYKDDVSSNLILYKDEVITAVSDATCDVDITPINDSLDEKFAIIDAKIDDNFTAIIDNMSEKYVELSNSLSSVSFASLNGSAGTYRDGTLVNVTGLSGDYTVLSSQMMKNDDNQYIVIYKLDKDGSVSLFPSVMLTVSGS